MSLFLKSFGVLGSIAAGGMYMTGAFGSAYSRDVGRPVAEVMASMSDLDITKEPGGPGTDSSRSGGVRPMFVLDRTADTMTWKVMSGTQVATSMTATFKPIGDGSSTRVTASVVRGDAPDDFVSPAFRSKSITLGLFSIALETELDELTIPAGSSPEKCQQIMEQSLMEGAAGGERTIASGVQTIMSVNALSMKMRRAGCDTNNNGGEFVPVSNMMGAGGGGESGPPNFAFPSFEPGKPMYDVSTKK